MNVISEKEYSFSNALFWNVMLHHHIRAFDEERDANFDEVWDEELIPTLLDEKKYKKYWCWLSQIDLKTSENQGEIENPRTLTLPIGSDIVLTIEFHPCCTYYFLNDTLIGEVSGNFHLKYLTYSELMRITKEKYGDVLFHLLLPLSAIREQEKDIALNEIIQRLQQIPLFKEHSAYIGKCILNGLLISNSDIQEIRKVSDFEEVWGLKDKEGWALMGNNEQVLFPVWSEKEFAELCKWDNYQPNSIPLDDFIEKLLPKLEKDNVMLAVFPLSKGKGIIRTVQEIIADIERECEQYE